jgi:glycosyltransferase involved in cell wall biosynthesis
VPPVRNPVEPYVLAFGRLHAKKNVDLLVRAFHTLDLSGVEARWTLVIAGDGPADYVRHLRQLATAGPNASRIRFVGWQDGEARIGWLGGARLLAMPSEQENFGLAAVEAMAARVPVIVTPGVNLADEIAARQAGWVSPATADGLAAVLREAVTNDADRDERAGSARRLADRYRWSRIAPALVSMYERARALHGRLHPAPASSTSAEGRL